MEIRMIITLDKLLKDRNLTQKELAEQTGIRTAAISELVNNQRKSINKEHIEKIASYLELTNVADILTFEPK